MRAVYGGFLWQMMRQAKREMVLWMDSRLAGPWEPPGTVSVTTRSMGPSVERPTCGHSHEQYIKFMSVPVPQWGYMATHRASYEENLLNSH